MVSDKVTTTKYNSSANRYCDYNQKRYLRYEDEDEVDTEVETEEETL